jgi:hypothetical protein
MMMHFPDGHEKVNVARSHGFTAGGKFKEARDTWQQIP